MQRHIDAIQTPIPSMRIIICILGILLIIFNTLVCAEHYYYYQGSAFGHGQIGVDAAITLRENQLKDKLGYDY